MAAPGGYPNGTGGAYSGYTGGAPNGGTAHSPKANGASGSPYGGYTNGSSTRPAGVDPRTMPLSAAVTPPTQYMDRANELATANAQGAKPAQPGHQPTGSADYYVDEKDPYATPSAGRLTRITTSARSTMWGRPWDTPAGTHLRAPPGDYRDQLPPTMLEIAEAYKDIPRNGDWTFGMLEMWGSRSKIPKSVVHVPCWEAYTVNPYLWRGSCFGRTCHQCFWLGVDRTRWARQAYGAGLGREFKVPCLAVPEAHYKGRIAALCLFQCCITESAGSTIGAFTGPGFCYFNFAACYTCHSREKIRRKYNLPATFGLPVGFDDCCTHFLCMYCATHQEARELAVRGVDGPGMHVLDVCPDGFKHLPGFKEALEERAKVREILMARPPGEFQTMGRRIRNDPGFIGGAVRPQHAAQMAAGKLATSYQPPQQIEAPSKDAPAITDGSAAGHTFTDGPGSYGTNGTHV